jgi:hypothetical protein
LHRLRTGLALEAASTQRETAAERVALLQQALGYLGEADDLRPGQVAIMYSEAFSWTLLARDAPGRFADADGAWERLIAHDPLDWEPREGHAVMLIAWSNAEVVALEHVVALDPSDGFAADRLAELGEPAAVPAPEPSTG